MKIIAVVAQKGGVGKTTVTQCLAVEALRQGLATAIIDADPQRSATEWGEQRERRHRSTHHLFSRLAQSHWDR